jgi:hypothetical protein
VKSSQISVNYTPYLVKDVRYSRTVTMPTTDSTVFSHPSASKLICKQHHQHPSLPRLPTKCWKTNEEEYQSALSSPRNPHAVGEPCLRRVHMIYNRHARLQGHNRHPHYHRVCSQIYDPTTSLSKAELNPRFYRPLDMDVRGALLLQHTIAHVCSGYIDMPNRDGRIFCVRASVGGICTSRCFGSCSQCRWVV